MLNLMAIACAQLQALRLAPPMLLARCIEAMSRSEPKFDGAGDANAALALMQEVMRAKGCDDPGRSCHAGGCTAPCRPSRCQCALPQATSDTVPAEESVQVGLRTGLARGENMAWNLLVEDLWSLSDLFYSVQE